MKFEFDTVNDGATEAAALVTALAILHGDKVVEAIDKAVSRIDVSGTSTLAADGYPMPQGTSPAEASGEVLRQEPSAADAFGEHIANTPPAPPPAPTGALDAAGIPWDERIHASTKTTNKDGTWTRRRNTPDATFDAVMAELKGAPPTPVAGTTETPPSPPAPPAPPAAEVAPVSPVPSPPATETPAAPNTSTPAASPTSASSVPPPPPPAGALTFPQIMVKVTKAQGASKITKEDVAGYLGSCGLAAMKDLASADKDTLAAFDALIDGHIDG